MGGRSTLYCQGEELVLLVNTASLIFEGRVLGLDEVQSWLFVGGNFERYTKLKKIIALLRLAIGLSVGRKVHSSEVEMVECDIVFDDCCMKDVGCSCCDKPTPLMLKMIHKLLVDLHSQIMVDESVDVNWKSKKKYIDSFDVTIITNLWLELIRIVVD
ncbi:hypothetical protein Tco_0175550 [Tanacetum coccineum]